jgi:hypothetical protein
MLDVFDVSRKELQRAEILDDVKAGRLSLKESPQSAGVIYASFWMHFEGMTGLRRNTAATPFVIPVLPCSSYPS